MEPKTIAELLNDLFRTHRKPDGREYSNSELSRALKGQLSPDYISKLRRGEVTNPGRNALLLLCRFFGVSPEYFFPELSAEHETPGEETAETDSSKILSRRIAELSPEARSQIAKLIDLLRRRH